MTFLSPRKSTFDYVDEEVFFKDAKEHIIKFSKDFDAQTQSEIELAFETIGDKDESLINLKLSNLFDETPPYKHKKIIREYENSLECISEFVFEKINFKKFAEYLRENAPDIFLKYIKFIERRI